MVAPQLFRDDNSRDFRVFRNTFLLDGSAEATVDVGKPDESIYG